ncbi:MAG: hypothetical protein J7L95_01505 [Prolixibacteraceae bacterium]|nr:hypothetical protein [Prolixibacteraceae bacterium]
MIQPEENTLFGKVKQGDEKAFEILFHRYYGYLCEFATNIVKNDAAAEEIVQDLFVKFWVKRNHIFIETSIKRRKQRILIGDLLSGIW